MDHRQQKLLEIRKIRTIRKIREFTVLVWISIGWKLCGKWSKMAGNWARNCQFPVVFRISRSWASTAKNCWGFGKFGKFANSQCYFEFPAADNYAENAEYDWEISDFLPNFGPFGSAKCRLRNHSCKGGLIYRFKENKELVTINDDRSLGGYSLTKLNVVYKFVLDLKKIHRVGHAARANP